MAKSMVEAASLIAEGQNINGLREEIFRHPHRGLNTPLYKASLAKG